MATIAENIARQPFAWPGGYERYAVTDDGACLCWRCCRDEDERIAEATEGDGFFVIAEDNTSNADQEPIQCDHCGMTVYDPEE